MLSIKNFIFFLPLNLILNISYANNNFEDCTKYTENDLRLACYDQIAKYHNNDVEIEKPKENITSKEINLSDNPQKISELYEKNQQELESLDNLTFLQKLNIFNYLRKVELLNHKKKFSNANDKQQFLNKAYLESYSTLSQKFDLDANKGLFKLRSHNDIYLMPFLYNSHPNKYPYTKTQGTGKLFDNEKKIETKIQLSFKMKIADNLFNTPADLWFGYTQTSFWQSYDKRDSAPFRETNYAPEFFITYPFKYYLPNDIVFRMFNIGLIHESNGREDPISRSWNRVYLMTGFEWHNLTIIPTIWWKIYQGKRDKQDNPDILDYKGIGEIKLLYKLNNNKLISASIHGTPFNNKKAGLRLRYSFPIKNSLKFFIQGFYGYGDNLIDYNVKTKSIGFGLLLNDFDGI